MKTIPKPTYCGQNWLEMKPTQGGRICGQCEKKIVDFSKMSWAEIENLQQKNNNALCGMYHPKQLDYWGQEIPRHPIQLLKTLILTGLTASLSLNSYSQITPDSLVIEGKIVDSESKEPLPYATVMLKNRKIGVLSDLDGNFELVIGDIQKNSLDDTMMISYVGYTSKQIIFNEAKEIEKIDLALIGLNQSEPVLTQFYVIKPTLRDRIKLKFNQWFGQSGK